MSRKNSRAAKSAKAKTKQPRPMTESEIVELEKRIAERADWLTEDGKKAAVLTQAFRSMTERTIGTPEAYRRLLEAGLCNETESGTITSSAMAKLAAMLRNDQDLLFDPMFQKFLETSSLFQLTPEKRNNWIEETTSRFIKTTES